MQSKSTEKKAVFAEVPQCLCEQVMDRLAEKPRLRFSSARNEFLMYCPTCGFRTHPDGNKQSVIAEWYGCNRKGDQHIESLWVERYEKQLQETTAARRSDSCNSGTVVPL
ncbi:hypothetical protein KOEU_37080 [Komagataeibacter europaeus]|uniref:Uncharacterized protein n=1 Tax=Komagataeibacter europaeus TaxID=33995 RepID=A0A0M0EC15_KOMEU|nr:hypothetical protein KOEU_37080 [Komagataeibacter europaeus]